MKKRAVKSKIKHSFVLGIASDFWLVILFLRNVLSFPFRVAAKIIHEKLPAKFRHKHGHAIIGAAIGVIIMSIAFGVESFYHHAAWSCSIEVVKACGACPVWEACSKAFNSTKFGA